MGFINEIIVITFFLLARRLSVLWLHIWRMVLSYSITFDGNGIFPSFSSREYRWPRKSSAKRSNHEEKKWNARLFASPFFVPCIRAGKLVNQEISVWFANPIKNRLCWWHFTAFSLFLLLAGMCEIEYSVGFFPASDYHSTFEREHANSDFHWRKPLTTRNKTRNKGKRKKRGIMDTRCSECKKKEEKNEPEPKSNYVLWCLNNRRISHGL